MLKQKKSLPEKTKVSFRGGFGSKSSVEVPFNDLANLSAKEVAGMVVSSNISNPDFQAQSTAKSQKSILDDPTSDIDMRIHTKTETIPVSRDKLDTGKKLEELLKDTTLSDLTEIELSASRMARGGSK